MLVKRLVRSYYCSFVNKLIQVLAACVYLAHLFSSINGVCHPQHPLPPLGKYKYHLCQALDYRAYSLG